MLDGTAVKSTIESDICTFPVNVRWYCSQTYNRLIYVASLSMLDGTAVKPTID